MATLLHVYCPNCVHIMCAASPLIPEALTSMEGEDKTAYQRLISMEMLFVFCKKRKKFRAINILG